ncbi:MAG: YceI family protein [Balneola sp.]|nr:MAG: YceI family protein [Balneola sp.]
MIDYRAFLLLLSFFPFFLVHEHAHARQTNQVKSIILEGSKLRINGTSNVSNFECNYIDPIATDTLNQTITFGDSLSVTGDSIQLSSSSFDCGKRAINKDLRKTLKAKDFPFLELKLESIEIADEVPFQASLLVFIAGIKRIEPVTITEFSSEEEIVSFKGEGSILLTDFDLKPPSALFGLIKVNHQVDIHFDLTLEL